MKPVFAVILVGLLVAASTTDVLWRRIPNKVCACLAVAGCAYAISVAASPASGIAFSLLGIATGFGLWVPFYALRWLGAGDVKLFAASSAWLGAAHSLEAAALTALAGGFLALVWSAHTAVILRRGAAGHRESTTRGGPDRELSAPRRVPYGVAMAAGVLVAALSPMSLRGLL